MTTKTNGVDAFLIEDVNPVSFCNSPNLLFNIF